MKFFNTQQKGVSIVIVFLIMSICLSIVLGISTILIGQSKIINNVGNSVRAIYLADSGIEKTLYYDKNSTIVTNVGNGATRGICNSILACSSLGSNCTHLPTDIQQTGCDPSACTDCTISFTGSLPNNSSFSMKLAISSASTSTDSFFQSTGNYNGTSRVIELDILK